VYGIAFLANNGFVGLVTLGAVFLVVTGSEALYADLGHFGRKPIQMAWFILVLPSLLINYFGQGALVLANPAAVDEPFYRLVPETMLLPMVVLATAATVIASQAVITGAYSLTRQAIQLGLLPRFEIRHTSEEHYGQIYMPRVNTLLLIGVLLLVALFRTSSSLAAAYVLAVAATEFVASLLGFVVIWKVWKWQLSMVTLLMVPFIAIDAVFLTATMLKIAEGAWVPVLFGIVMILIVLTWRRGTRILANKTRKSEVPLETLLHSLEKKPPHMVPGTAVFLTSDPAFAPTALLHNLKHNKVLHERVVFLAVVTEGLPQVPPHKRVSFTHRGDGFYSVVLHYGFMENVDVPHVLETLDGRDGLRVRPMETTYVLGRETLVPGRSGSGLPAWRDHLFAFMSHNARPPAAYFRLPPDQVIEVGARIEL
jgi:KUP system potassium uptake protein